MGRKRFLMATALVLTLVMGLSGCGRSQGQLGSGASGGQSNTRTTQLVIGFSGDASYLNPVIASDGQSYKAEWPIFDSLVELDKSLKPQPLLAEKWDISPDGKAYTFHLRQDVKWQDGQPFTADDVAFTFYSVLDPKVKSPHQAFFSALVGFKELTDPKNPADSSKLAKKPIEVVDKYTVRFNLEYPYSPFLSILTNPRGGIVPKHLLEGKDLRTADFNQKPVGTGPFKVVEWKKDDRLVLEANKDYFAGKPKIDRIIYRVIPDPVVQMQELRSGGIDMVDMPPLEEVAGLKSDPNYRVFTAATPSYQYFGFRLDREPFSDKRVRQAISYAVDFDGIIKKALLGYATRATGQLPPDSWAYNHNVKTYPYNSDKAKEILAEAGWRPGPDGILQKDGKPFKFTVTGDQANQQVKDSAVIIQEQLAKVGIKMEVKLIDWPTFVKRLFASEFEGILVGWTNHPDPDPFAYTIWHSSQWKGRNFAHYKNPEVDEMLEKARRATSLDERKKYYARFQELLAEDAPYVWGYYPQEIYTVRKQFKGLETIPAQAAIYQSLKHAYAEK